MEQIRIHADSRSRSHPRSRSHAVARLAPPRSRSRLLALLLPLLLLACVTPQPGSPGSTTTADVPAQSPDARGLIVIVHGANHRADGWPLEVEERIRAHYDVSRWDFFRPDWPQLSDRYLSGATDGYALGRRYGAALAAPGYSYEVMHLIGNSLGAHVVHGLAAAYRETRAGVQALIHMTFIDPFVYRDLLRPRYGVSQFGRHADVTDNYYTRDEPVWFSNTPLDHATNFDVSPVVPPREDPYFTYYHDYPMVYYRNSVGRLRPGFSLSPLALGVLHADSTYEPSTLQTILPPGVVRTVRRP